jgi:hypothetical protein
VEKLKWIELLNLSKRISRAAQHVSKASCFIILAFIDTDMDSFNAKPKKELTASKCR